MLAHLLVLELSVGHGGWDVAKVSLKHILLLASPGLVDGEDILRVLLRLGLELLGIRGCWIQCCGW